MDGPYTFNLALLVSSGNLKKLYVNSFNTRKKKYVVIIFGKTVFICISYQN